MTTSPLTPAEKEFYSRQILLEELSVQGQERLKNSSVLLIGLGGLGSPTSLYLAAAGVGKIGIFEFDRVEQSNLHRQVLYGVSELGKPKLEVGIARLKNLNPYIEIVSHSAAFNSSHAREAVRGYDLVIDGTDNFPTRYRANDACVLEGKPLVSASVLQFEGQLSVFNYNGGPCYRCLYPSPPPAGMAPSCGEAGVLGVLPGILGTLQANEALKILLGIGEVLSGKLISFNALAASFQEYQFSRNDQCAVCGTHPTILDIENEEEQIEQDVDEIYSEDLRRDIAKYTLIDVRSLVERNESKIEPSLHIPLAEILEGRAKVPAGKSLVLYCASGIRSAQAARYLTSNGRPNVFSLAGGIRAWLSGA